MSKSIVVPQGHRPLEIVINGVRTVLTPGQTVSVPDEVAELLANNAENKIPQESAHGQYPYRVTFEMPDFYGNRKTNDSYTAAMAAWREGRIVYAMDGEKVYFPSHVDIEGTFVFVNRQINDSKELIEQTISWPKTGPAENKTIVIPLSSAEQGK